MNQKNKLCVCIPTYNRNDMLCRLLQSIDNKVNVVVSDNGEFVSDKIRHIYPNIFFSSTTTIIDMFSNWNRAVELSNAEYIVIPSDDDLYLENAFDKITDEINKSPEVDMFIFGHNVIDEVDKVVSTWCVDKSEQYQHPDGFKIFEYGVDARMPSIVFKKDFLDRIGLFDIVFKLTAADSELIQRALLSGTVKFIPYVISCYRVWGGGLTAQKQASQQWLDEIKYWTDKIGILAEEQYHIVDKKFDCRRYADEILAQNIISGVNILINKKKNKEARRFLLSVKIPSKAIFRTKLALYKKLLSLYLRIK